MASLLTEKGIITQEQQEWALDVHARTGSSVTTIVVAAGLVKRLTVYRVLAELAGVPFIELTDNPPDPGLLALVDPDQLIREGWVPVRWLADGTVLVAAEYLPRSSLLRSIARALGCTVTFQVTTDWDIRKALERGCRDHILDQAALGLWRRSARYSARTALYRRQGMGLAAVLAIIVACAVLWPIGTLQTASLVVSIAFLVTVAFKFIVCMAGTQREQHQAVTDAEVAALADEDLPVYTVLAPMFHEASVVGELITNLAALDYPPSKLEVLLLLEEDDTETIEAAKAAGLPQWMTIIVVPRGVPQTKPKACNVGLFFARGQHLVIYDAEDKPDPDQLKKAVVAFRRGGPDLVCVQAALNYWNVYENFLTRMFTAEYSFWFDYMLPGLDVLNLPIPLGGTSNHFRTDGLRLLGAWDPFNVTEDADLGIRAAALGYTVGVINSTTFEEANRKTGNWIRQRSRWIKGYLQTTLVHARAPWTLVRAVGLRQATGFALLIAGTPLSFLFVLPLWVIFIACLLAPAPLFGLLFSGWGMWVALFNLLVGNALMIYVSMVGAFYRERYPLVLWALLNPAYWMFHSIASYKALWQLIVKPHYWEKTTHGISSLPALPASAAEIGGEVPRQRPAGG
jgi:cellulose synthase/poly-beta-1,6-N-acetylglucosamine synthase-like glycosyltransferase